MSFTAGFWGFGMFGDRTKSNAHGRPVMNFEYSTANFLEFILVTLFQLILFFRTASRGRSLSFCLLLLFGKRTGRSALKSDIVFSLGFGWESKESKSNNSESLIILPAAAGGPAGGELRAPSPWSKKASFYQLQRRQRYL